MSGCITLFGPSTMPSCLYHKSNITSVSLVKLSKYVYLYRHEFNNISINTRLCVCVCVCVCV